ncbi:MAG: YopT-type cysteine protease domain-containing protein [Legionella sp.]|uniref:YopT-type cysteine protease domain-containing protein n=1 Tax=Legionella sp. TaxID=459 RepID=UPI00284CCDAD|nr:YopT-type cysteine protease domain-containing protein [Legionella sp.]
MFERFKKWVSDWQEHTRFVGLTYDKYQETLKEQSEALSQSGPSLLERAGKESAYQEAYFNMYHNQKYALEDYQQNIPTSKFLFYIRHMFSSTINFIRATEPLVSKAQDLEQMTESNKRNKPAYDLWQDHEQNTQLFGQGKLTGKYSALNSRGVCDGLISEWSRFHKKYPHGEENFIEKLNNKLNSDTPENFVKRVATLHTQQAFHKQHNKDFFFATEGRMGVNNKNAARCSSQEEIITQTINYFNENPNNNLTAIDFRMEDLNDAHAVGIRCVRNDEQEIEAYVFYDPNIGEVTFKGENKEQKLKDFFVKWTETLPIALTPLYQNVATSPTIQITLETHTTSSRIGLLDEKKKEQLHTPKPSIMENTPSPTPDEPQVANETHADNDNAEEPSHSMKM